LTREVQPQDTVAEQLDRLLKSDSPYLEQARIGAIEQANARGLLNSSLAAGAGEAAAIRAALPIVTQDASTYFTQGRDNQAAINQFRFNQQTSDLNAELARLNTSLNTDSASRLSRLNNDLAMTRDNQNFGFQQQLQQGQFQNNRALQSDQFGQNKALQSDQIASNERMRALDIEAQDRARQEDFEHGVVSGVSNAVIKNNEDASNNISAIYANPGLTPEQQEKAVKIEEQKRDTNNQFLYDLGDSILGWSYDWFSLTDGQ
jgi:hypothetical protein